ncbi:MAG: anhydro-N-acetylmuramic acid kinase [Ignavibacteria bacterium]|nr:anhydro-N-acetylmuramic acid kinase [Ignavibacteria bacterium]
MKLIFSKHKKKLAVGLMSGTSLDGIDAVVCEIEGNGISIKVQTLACETFPYATKFREYILKNSHPSTAKLDDICRLNFLFSEMFADAVKKIVKKSGRNISEIDFIGSHGQTIQHLPKATTLFGKHIRSTLQIGDASVIAKLTGIVTVGDFRVGDVAFRGTGAPLVPYVDYCLFRSTKEHRALLNIGGIANMTLLPKNCSLQQILAFDTGAGNMVIDALMKIYFKKQFDRNGKIASKGNVHQQLLCSMQRHSYFRKPLPKSTGREDFGKEFVEILIRESTRWKLSNEDVIATATYFTGWGVWFHLKKIFVKKKFPNEIIVSGGGAHNKTMLKFLQEFFPRTIITPIDAYGISSDAKEAIAFAILANETLHGNSSNVPSVTGATRATILGKICLP